MKPTLPELREPTCCCIGVRKLTFTLALIQASTLFFSLAMLVVGMLRDPSILARSFGYEVTNNELSLFSVSVSGDAQAETVAVELLMNSKAGDGILAINLMEPQTLDEMGAIVGPLPAEEIAEPNEPVLNGIQLRIIEEYEVASLPSCHAWREILLVLTLVSTACCFTVLALVGVLRAKPTYLLPYWCVHFCDLVLTAGTLLTACAYMRCRTDAAREWLSTQRYVAFDDAVRNRLLHLSEAELQVVLVLAGTIVFGLKAIWFSTVSRCYTYLMKLKKRRMLNRCVTEAGSLMPIDEKSELADEKMICLMDNVEEKRPLSPPPIYDEVAQEKPLSE